MDVCRNNITNEQLDTIIHGIYGLASRLDDVETKLGQALHILENIQPPITGMSFPSDGQDDFDIDPFTVKNTDDDNLGIF